MFDIWQIWIISGLILLILEIFTSGFFLASIGLAAIVTGGFALIGVKSNFQILIFCVSSLIIFFSLYPVYKRVFINKKNKKETGAKALLNQTGRVTTKIEKNNPGRILINGEDWRAVSLNNNEELDVDTTVIVTKIEGVTVFVEKQF